MRKVIRGRLYDTDTAKKIGCVSEVAELSDNLEQILYQKRTGEFFLHCRDNAGNNAGSGEQIQVLSYDQAQSWVENNLPRDDYIAIFGAPVDSSNRKTINISITTGAADLLKKSAHKNGISVSELVERLIRGNLPT